LSTLEASDRPLRPTRTNEGMQFVDEQDSVACSAHLVHDGLDAFLELATILRACDHHGQIKHDDAAITQQFRHIAGDDHLRQSLDDGGLADTGFFPAAPGCSWCGGTGPE